MSICVKRKKKCWKIYYSPCGFREDIAPKELTNHNARHLSQVETGRLSGGLCGRQGLPYSHKIHAHYLSINVHLKCVASEDDWYLCKNLSISFALRERILIRCCCCCCCYCWDIFASVMPDHHWFRKWLGVRSVPSHYLEQYRSSETIGLRPKDISLLNKTKQTFYQVQFIWKQKRMQILHRVCARHYLNQWWLDVSWRFQISSTILSANVHSQCVGLCHGI